MIDSDNNVPITKGIYQNDIDNSRTILRDSFAQLIDENESTKDSNKNYSFSLKFNQKNIILLLFILSIQSMIVTYFVVDKRFYTDDETKKILRKKFFLTSFYTFSVTVVYLTVFYFFIKFMV